MVNVLTGGGSRVTTEDGTVAIDTAQIVENVKARLDARGITVFDDFEPKNEQFVLFQSEDLAEVQGLVDLLQTIAWVLPFVALGLLRRRDRALREPTPHRPARCASASRSRSRCRSSS